MNVRFKDDILHDCSLEFKAGDRMVITGSRNGGKRVAFYALLGIFEPDHILGDIYINRTPIYKQRITRASLSQLIFFLEQQNMHLKGDTVEEVILVSAPRR